MEFDKDFSNNTDTRLFNRKKRQIIKITHNALNKLVDFMNRKRLKLLLRATVPFFVQCISTARNFFVRTHTVQTAHEKIARHNRHKAAVQKRECNLESGVILESLIAQTDNRNSSPACVVERAADKADVVCCTAAAACLRDNQPHVVQIVLARFKRGNHLPRNENRRIARIVINIFKASLNSLRVNSVENDKVISAVLERLLNNTEVNRAHLRSDNRMRIFHLFCKDLPLVCSALYDCGAVVTLTFLDCRDKTANAYADSSEVAAFVNLNKRVHAAF